MTVKELKARLEEFNENAVVVFPDHEHGDLLVDYADGVSEYMSLVGLCETKNAFTWAGESYGEVLMLDVEQDKVVVYNTLKI